MHRLSALALLLMMSCRPKPVPPVAVAAETTQRMHPQGLIIPTLDDRDYRYFKLENGMKVLVVSDPDVDMAAAALDVHVGQFSDPEDREGLAHFLEHMLFLGTDAFPDVDAYRDFIQSHGGSSNAATGQEHTRYHFKVEHGHLEGALDRFSAFFTSPRLDREYVTREREAVNSEYRLKIQTQSRRFREVRRATSNPAHGFSQFSVGNLDTLADRPDDSVWDDLKSFYDSQYSADRMAVTIVGRESLDTLEGFARDRFAAVASGAGPAPTQTAPVFLPEQLGVRINVQPLDEVQELYMEFPMPAALDHYTQRPLGLLTKLLGQEGPGSPHAVLTQRGWILSLTTLLDGAEDHAILAIRMPLTDAGLEHVDDVAAVIFQYMRLLQSPGDVLPYWQEHRSLKTLGFEFAEPASSSSLAQSTVRSLQLYPPEQVLSYWATFDEWNPSLISEHVQRVSPDNLRMFVTAPGISTDQIEPRYDAPYSLEPLEEALKQQWRDAAADPALALPPLNTFIPQDTSMLEGETSSVPVQVVDEPGLSVWHHLDTSFMVPKGSIEATIHLPDKVSTLEEKMYASLWVDLVRRALAPTIDQAITAGTQIALNYDPDGIFIGVSGFNDQLNHVLTRLLEEALTAPLEPERFDDILAYRVRQYRNTQTSRPIDQVGWGLSEALSPRDWSYMAAADVLEGMTIEGLEAWRAALFSQASIEVLVAGNLSAASAVDAGRVIAERLGMPSPIAPVPIEVRQVPIGRDLYRTVKVDHDDSAIRVLFQSADTSLQSQATWLMLGNLLKTPAFTQLRTEQQLGYIVWAGYDRRDHVPGLTVNIQSGVSGPTGLLERIETFLNDLGPHLEQMSDEEFETIKTGLIATLEEKPTLLKTKTRDLSRDLSLGVTSFDRKAQLVSHLKPMDKATVLALFQDHVLGDQARRLVILATGHAHASELAPDGACPDSACLIERLGAPISRSRE